LTGSLLTAPLAAEAQGGYKPEFKMSVVVNEETAWGRAAIRFADAVEHQEGRQICGGQRLSPLAMGSPERVTPGTERSALTV
jgi:hypothetical protein